MSGAVGTVCVGGAGGRYTERVARAGGRERKRPIIAADNRKGKERGASEQSERVRGATANGVRSARALPPPTNTAPLLTNCGNHCQSLPQKSSILIIWQHG